MKTLKVSEELVEGKYGIGFTSSDFDDRFEDEEFEEINTPPTFQVLPRDMTIKEIESELKSGFCSLSDLHAFFKNPPEDAKDGKWNIFIFKDIVVRVGWGSVGECWYVHAWRRDGGAWRAGARVFSPATDSSSVSVSPLPSEPVALRPLKIISESTAYYRIIDGAKELRVFWNPVAENWEVKSINQ